MHQMERNQSDAVGLVQLVLRKAECTRVRRGAEPVFEFELLAHERIVGVQYYFTRDYRGRTTVDHHVHVWVAVDLRPGQDE